MKTLFRHIRRFLLSLGIVALAGLSACGAGGGSGAAPSGDGGGVVAVEIPAVNDIGDIMYITGPVVAGASGNLSAKSLGGVSTAKESMNVTYASGDSLNACITANVMRDVFKSGAMPDLMLCLLKNHIAPEMAKPERGGIDVYDSQDHDAAIWIEKSHGAELAKFRVNITKNSAGNLTQFTVYACGCLDDACNLSSQTLYMKEVIDPATNAVTITSKDVESSDSATLGVTGTATVVNGETVFDPDDIKTITHSSRNESTNDQGETTTFTQRTIFSQGADTATVDGFQRAVGVGTIDTRVYGNFGFTYTGDPAVVDFDDYDYGAGASNLIDGILDQTQCWDSDGKIATYPCVPYSTAIFEKTPMAVSDVPAVTFSTGESINCSSITPTYTQGTEEEPLAIETSQCSGFKELDSHMDCYKDIYGVRDEQGRLTDAPYFTVTTTINGSILSPNTNTTGVGTTPTIVLTTNYTPYLSSFFGPKDDQMGTIILQAGGGQILSTSEFEASDWVSAATPTHPEAMSLSLHPTLDPAQGTYTLSLNHGLSGINGSSIGSTLYFQITP